MAIKTFNWHSPDNSVRNTDTMDYFAYFCTWHIPSSQHVLIRDLLRPSLRCPLECTRPQTLTWQHIKRGLRYCRVFVISGAVFLLFYELLIERFFFVVIKENIEKKRKRIIVRKFWFLSTRIFGVFLHLIQLLMIPCRSWHCQFHLQLSMRFHTRVRLLLHMQLFVQSRVMIRCRQSHGILL